MKSLFLLLLLCHVSSPVKHSLKFLITVTSGIQNLPELVIVALVDDVQTGYCDSNKTMEEHHDVWKKLFKDNPGLMEQNTQDCFEIQPKHFKFVLDRIMQHFNQSGGVHILQYIGACESDEQTGNTYLVEVGYDGEDFMSLDLTKRKWISHKPETDVIKQEWEADKGGIEEMVHIVTQLYPEWLKLALKYGESFLSRTDLPSVSLLQKSPSSPVSCHATGFYPDRATMFWRKDGQELHEDVAHGETLPNHDGTFQMSMKLDVSSVKSEDWKRYDCVFQLSGVRDDVTIQLDKSVIRTNETSMGLIIAIVAVVVLVALIGLIGFIIYRKKTAKRPPSPVSSTDVMEQLNPTN